MIHTQQKKRGEIDNEKYKEQQLATTTPKKVEMQQLQPMQMSLINPETEARTNHQSTLKKLIDINEQYLIERTKISDVRKPSKYSHKMPSRTGQSQYNGRFGSSRRHYNTVDSVPERDRTGSLMKLPNQQVAGYCSTYHFKKKDQVESKKANNKQMYSREDAPRFTETSYQRDYRQNTRAVTESAKKQDVPLMGGGHLATTTTYGRNFRSKAQTAQRAQPVRHKNHKIFLTLADIPKQSSYKQNFIPNHRKQAKQQSCKPKAKYSANPNKSKYNTEYSQVFIKRPLPEQREFEYLSHQQLKDYVMNILNQ